MSSGRVASFRFSPNKIHPTKIGMGQLRSAALFLVASWLPNHLLGLGTGWGGVFCGFFQHSAPLWQDRSKNSFFFFAWQLYFEWICPPIVVERGENCCRCKKKIISNTLKQLNKQDWWFCSGVLFLFFYKMIQCLPEEQMLIREYVWSFYKVQ